MAAAFLARAKRLDFFFPAWFKASLTLSGPREEEQYFLWKWRLGITLLCFTIFHYKKEEENFQCDNNDNKKDEQFVISNVYDING